MDLHDEDDRRYLSLEAPAPALPFMDIRQTDLPFRSGNLVDQVVAFSTHKSAPSGTKALRGAKRKQGAALLAALTGVHCEVHGARARARAKPSSPPLPVPPKSPGSGTGCGRVSCRVEKEVQHAAVDSIPLASGRKKSVPKQAPQRSRSACSMVDESVDTGDLEGLVFNLDADEVPEGESSSSSDEGRDDPMFDRALLMERSSQEYFALVRESMGRIGLRTQLLQDLALGEGSLPTGSGKDTPSSPGGRPSSSSSATQPAAGGAAQDPDVPYMSQTSASCRQARKLAGVMHVDEQNLDLRDILTWMQRIGAVSEEGNKYYAGRASVAGEPTDLMKLRLEGAGASDWRLPASPPIALQLAYEDLHNRLANLFQEKNFLSNKIKSIEKDDDMDEELAAKPTEYLLALRALVCFFFSGLRALMWKRNTSFLERMCHPPLMQLSVWRNATSCWHSS